MGTAKGLRVTQCLNWIPRSHWKKAIICLAILIIVLGFTMDLEVPIYTMKNRLDLEVNDLQMITVGSSSALELTSHNYSMYMYLGCTASSFASVFWHVSQAVKVCDLSSPGQCEVKLKKDYTYDELGLKAQEWLQSDRFSQMLDQNDVIVKLDDDTIISKDTLDDLVNNFVKSDCKLAGAMRMRQEDGLFWSTGPLFLVKADYLKQQLRDNGDELQKYEKHEDVQMSALLNLRDRKSVCNIDVNKFKHRYYQDSRMTIRYKPYVEC